MINQWPQFCQRAASLSSHFDYKSVQVFKPFFSWKVKIRSKVFKVDRAGNQVEVFVTFPGLVNIRRATRESKSDGGRERRNRDSEKGEMLSEQILARRKSCIGEILPTLRGSKPKTSVSPSISRSIYEYFSVLGGGLGQNKCTRYNPKYFQIFLLILQTENKCKSYFMPFKSRN